MSKSKRGQQDSMPITSQFGPCPECGVTESKIIEGKAGESFRMVCLDGHHWTYNFPKEKPKDPKSSYAVIGIYMYDAKVFEIINGLTPSARNELEITDVNSAYLADGTLEYEVLEGWWSDAGTFESLRRSVLEVWG